MEAAIKKISALLLFIILSLGCATFGSTAEQQPTNPAQPIEVNTGETFTIILDSNPSTGYHWEIVGMLNENIVLFQSREYSADQPVTTGSGGVDVWTFTAVSAGQAQITLGSYPPGVDAASGGPEQTVSFDIIVK